MENVQTSPDGENQQAKKKRKTILIVCDLVPLKIFFPLESLQGNGTKVAETNNKPGPTFTES